MYNRLDGDKLLNDNRRRERTLIVGLELTMDTIDIDTSLDELQELVQAAGGGCGFPDCSKKRFYTSSLFYR